MNFEFTEEQRMLRDMVRDFAQNEVRPKAAEFDEKEEFPTEIVKQMGELGLMGIIFPEEYGGAGMDYVSYALAIEELSRVDGGVGLTVAAHNSLCCNHIYEFGTEAQKKKYLVPLAKGEVLGAWALTEPNAGSDAGGTQTTAVLDGYEWVLNGTKVLITHGTVGAYVIIMAVTDKSKGSQGISSFIVETDNSGYKARKEHKMSVRCSDTSEIALEDCRIPKENLIGELGSGFKAALHILDGGRISIAAMAVGIGQGALDEAIKYSKERVQFGKTISQFQAVQWMLADSATEIEAARLLTYRCAAMKDQGKKVTIESAMCKLYASEAGMRATVRALQIHGGYGLTKDYPIERHFRDVKLTQVGEGTSEIQRLVIARSILK